MIEREGGLLHAERVEGCGTTRFPFQPPTKQTIRTILSCKTNEIHGLFCLYEREIVVFGQQKDDIRVETHDRQTGAAWVADENVNDFLTN